MMVVIGSDDELSARFQCSVLGQRAKCMTADDKLWEIEQQEKKEEMELMTHHYGGFDLTFYPERDTSFTLRQRRYEEVRADFVKRVREGDDDRRALKDTKVGVYKTGKNHEGVIKGIIEFKANPPKPITFEPEQGKELILPLSLTELPILEREQADENGVRLSAAAVKKLEQERLNPKMDEQGNLVMTKRVKVKTLAISTWVYEIELFAPGYKPRKIFFYERPAPPDMDVKQMEKDGITAKPFKRRPDGRFVIDNASFDLIPEPKTLQTRYIQLLKETYCMKSSKEYKGRTEQGKKDAEDLLWDQKAFTPELRDIAQQNDEDPEFIKLKEAEFKGYKCPKYE
jgi:hypothetical protein